MNKYVIDKASLAHNIAKIVEKAGESEIIGVIKGDGYGIGISELANELISSGVHFLAVTDPADVKRLRDSGAECDILLMAAVSDREVIKELIALNTVFTVTDKEVGGLLNSVAEELGRKAKAHIKIDTGMGRYGFLPSEREQLKDMCNSSPQLDVCGIYTHFSKALDKKTTKKQFILFMDTITYLKNEGVDVGVAHCCNSGAFFNYPEMHCDAVRIGSAFLGRVNAEGANELKRVGYLKTEIEQIRTLPKGSTVGYGGKFKAKAETNAAVIPIGYINGFGTERSSDKLSFSDCIHGIYRAIKTYVSDGRIFVNVNGKRCPVIGRIGMVSSVIDVSGIDCKVGDEVTAEVNPLLVRNVKISYE